MVDTLKCDCFTVFHVRSSISTTAGPIQLVPGDSCSALEALSNATGTTLIGCELTEIDDLPTADFDAAFTVITCYTEAANEHYSFNIAPIWMVSGVLESP